MILNRAQNRLLKSWLGDDDFLKSLDTDERVCIATAYWNMKQLETILDELNRIRIKYLLYLVKHKGYTWYDIDEIIKNGKNNKGQFIG